MPDGGRRARTIYEVAAEFRARLLRGEGEAVRALTREYAEAWGRLRGELEAVLAEIEAARKAGLAEKAIRGLIIERERLPRLLASIEREMAQFGDVAAEVISERQRQALRYAQEYVQTALGGTLRGRLGLVYADAVEEMVGFASDGSPLRELLDALGPEVSEAVRRELVQGIILGRNPRDTATAIRRAAGMGLTRALRMARTETMRAYREATRQHFLANPDVVTGWIWWSARDTRTCIACIAMHGTEHGLDEILDDHVNGRCAMVAIVRGERGRLTPEVQTGEAWFEGLDAERQREHMPSEAAYRAYKYGEVTLGDFVGRKEDARWGSMRYARSLSEMVGEERAKWWAEVGRYEKAQGFSDDPLDWAVRRALFQGETLDRQTAEALLARVSGAAFAEHTVRPYTGIRGQSYLGVELRGRVPSVDAHVAKRVLFDREWAYGTTAGEYVRDLQRAVQQAEFATMHVEYPNSVNRVYAVQVFAQTAEAVPRERLGPKHKPWVCVIYSANHGKIVSGYQMLDNDVEQLRAERVVLWTRAQ